MNLTPTFALPSRLIIGGGSLAQAGPLLKSLRLRRPLIVTDPFLAASPMLGALQASFEGSPPPPVFADTIADPTTESVDRLVRRIKSGRFDCLVAIGGGSPMDTAKAASVLSTHGGRMRDYKAPFQMHEPSLPLVCIPTTAGTGSEVTKFTIVTDVDTNEKMLCIGFAYMPLAAIVDYQLTLSMPKRLTADTGIDAFCHAMEAFVSRRNNPFSDDLALSAVRRIAKALPGAYHTSDPWCREHMMLAATEAGLAFSSSSVTLIHGMSRPLGAQFHVPHGLSNAMLAPLVSQFSLSGAIPRYAQVARAAGWAGATCSDDAAALAVPRALLNWNRELGVPSMQAFGIDNAKFLSSVPKMVSDAMASGSHNNNPVVPSSGQIEALYRDIYGENVDAIAAA
jgi:alcohol dehydrogenase class IV